jgi:WD40 repeat protein
MISLTLTNGYMADIGYWLHYTLVMSSFGKQRNKDVNMQQFCVVSRCLSVLSFLLYRNSQTQTLVKSLEICDLPVRCAKFIPRKQWIICGSDDMQIRVYNYNTMEKVKTFEAHTDYIRSLAIHPTLPLVLSSSDDMFIKLWDWEKGWECTTLFEGHTHYVMQVHLAALSFPSVSSHSHVSYFVG